MSRFVAEGAAQARHLAFVLAVMVLGATGCGSDGTGPEQGPSISPLLDTDRRTGASIGPDGGSVAATAADGTEYSLVVPPDAVLEDTEISLTPILSIDDLPMSGGLIAGVHFEPSGLELFRTATLTVTLPEARSFGPEQLLAGFTYDGDGDNLALGIAAADANAFTLPITHFSGGGGGSATPADLRQAFSRGSADAFVAETLEAASKSDTATLESSIRRWYTELVKPALQAGVATDAALERALGEYRRWLLAASFASGLVDLNDVLSESQSLAAAAVNDAIARANDVCERRASFTEAEKVLLWQRRAESVLPEDLLLANGLDRASVLRDLCVQVVFESTFFPEAPAIGEPALLEVVVGFAFGEGPTELSSGMVVNVLATGATPAGATDVTDASGVVELTLSPNAATVEIEVDACIGLAVGAGTLTGSFVCQEAFIVRGLVVSPSTVTLAPGATQQFSAELLGVDEPVTWSATGGTIDPNGLFTAGSAAGTFTVTAASVAEPSLVATAEVTISGDLGPGADVVFTESSPGLLVAAGAFLSAGGGVSTDPCFQEFTFNPEVPGTEVADFDESGTAACSATLPDCGSIVTAASGSLRFEIVRHPLTGRLLAIRAEGSVQGSLDFNVAGNCGTSNTAQAVANIGLRYDLVGEAVPVRVVGSVDPGEGPSAAFFFLQTGFHTVSTEEATEIDAGGVLQPGSHRLVINLAAGPESGSPSAGTYSVELRFGEPGE